MGVEFYIICDQCKEYIDLHKAYAFSSILNSERPPIGDENSFMLNGGYWESRGLWFLWKHNNHGGVKIESDENDEWYNYEPYLTEVFKHEDDLKLRESK